MQRLVKLIQAIIIIVLSAWVVYSQTNNEESSHFEIVLDNQSVPIIYDQNDAEVVSVCCEALAKDIQLITDILPELHTEIKLKPHAAIIAGTIGKSKYIDTIINSAKLSVDSIVGKWESFIIQIVDKPLEGINRALVICGSDPRGTAFGIFELSKRLGVSPWVYWADVLPNKRKKLLFTEEKIIMGPPSVKYRGIFINDEDWGLQPWAAHNIDTDVKDIGPKTYAKIFELMLRLKANFIWPAMHPCTKAFFYYEGNPKMAKKYNIILGSSHAEPMLRNNVDEWKNNYKAEYGKEPGEWRYDKNSNEIQKYWQDRVKQVVEQKIDAVFTIGMRGIHDSGMPGPDKIEDKVELLNKVIEDQRKILSKYFHKNAAEIPQIFCPYKEVLDLFHSGLKIPDDVTIVWTDDNHGYIRKLSNSNEQLRKGGSGIYYHLSYWGEPEDYLWLCSISPSLISYEMTKAYEYGANQLWVFNVGDIKPAEMETEFAMDLAWDITLWKPNKAQNYIEEWAARTFGKKYAKEIAEIKTIYYRLAASGKPEHINKIEFTKNEFQKRLSLYQYITQKAECLKELIPEHLQDAYFQLILYPVLGAANMNKKIYYANVRDFQKAMNAYNEIKKLTDIYNKNIANGKWNGIMNMSPRNRPVFDIPDSNYKYNKDINERHPIKIISVNQLQFDSTKLCLLPGLGVDSISLSWIKFNFPSFSESNIDNAFSASIKLKLPKGKRIVEVFCLPTHPINEEHALRVGLSVDNYSVGIVDVNTIPETNAWRKNVIRGYASAIFEFVLKDNSMIDLKLSLPDPGLVINKIIIY